MRVFRVMPVALLCALATIPGAVHAQTTSYAGDAYTQPVTTTVSVSDLARRLEAVEASLDIAGDGAGK